MKTNIKEYNLKELEALLIKWKQKPFRAKQIFSWIYKKGVSDFNRMSNLPVDLKNLLCDNFYPFDLQLKTSLVSGDGTEKFLFLLSDGNLIEAVSIPAQNRVTGCVSTQVGCKFNCSFCASGYSGFKRNLSCGEILDEVFYLKNFSKVKKLTHLVFMGVGEPLDNYDNLIKAIRIINSDYSFNIGARRITISTCGIIPGIERLAKEDLQIELSVSLHAADDLTRSKLMPVNKKYPLIRLIAACRQYIEKTNRQITFEYILIKGINSDKFQAEKLKNLIKGLNCKVNLITFNPADKSQYSPCTKIEIQSFANYLKKSGITATARTPRGQDINSACGQLRLISAEGGS